MKKQTSEIEGWRSEFKKAWKNVFGNVLTNEALIETNNYFMKGVENILQDEKKKWKEEVMKMIGEAKDMHCSNHPSLPQTVMYPGQRERYHKLTCDACNELDKLRVKLNKEEGV